MYVEIIPKMILTFLLAEHVAWKRRRSMKLTNWNYSDWNKSTVSDIQFLTHFIRQNTISVERLIVIGFQTTTRSFIFADYFMSHYWRQGRWRRYSPPYEMIFCSSFKIRISPALTHWLTAASVSWRRKKWQKDPISLSPERQPNSSTEFLRKWTPVTLVEDYP